MAKLKTRCRKVLRNRRNANKLSSILAQLKQVQDDMLGGSDEQFALQVVAVATSIKNKKYSVDG